MASVSFSPKARQDLIDIGDYIARDNRANARRFVARLQGRCRQIGDAPLSYRSREDLAPGLRMAPLGRYVIFFRMLDDTVRIERVCMGRAICLWCLSRADRRVGHDWRTTMDDLNQAETDAED